jgi:hypothetical protein
METHAPRGQAKSRGYTHSVANCPSIISTPLSPRYCSIIKTHPSLYCLKTFSFTLPSCWSGRCLRSGPTAFLVLQSAFLGCKMNALPSSIFGPVIFKKVKRKPRLSPAGVTLSSGRIKKERGNEKSQGKWARNWTARTANDERKLDKKEKSKSNLETEGFLDSRCASGFCHWPCDLQRQLLAERPR